MTLVAVVSNLTRYHGRKQLSCQTVIALAGLAEMKSKGIKSKGTNS
jgi:tRNA-binding EMAP/Myf-like protein